MDEYFHHSDETKRAIKQIRDFCETPALNGGGMILVTGQRGVGKTRLVDEALNERCELKSLRARIERLVLVACGHDPCRHRRLTRRRPRGLSRILLPVPVDPFFPDGGTVAATATPGQSAGADHGALDGDTLALLRNLVFALTSTIDPRYAIRRHGRTLKARLGPVTYWFTRTALIRPQHTPKSDGIIGLCLALAYLPGSLVYLWVGEPRLALDFNSVMMFLSWVLLFPLTTLFAWIWLRHLDFARLRRMTSDLYDLVHAQQFSTEAQTRIERTWRWELKAQRVIQALATLAVVGGGLLAYPGTLPFVTRLVGQPGIAVGTGQVGAPEPVRTAAIGTDRSAGSESASHAPSPSNSKEKGAGSDSAAEDTKTTANGRSAQPRVLGGTNQAQGAASPSDSPTAGHGQAGPLNNGAADGKETRSPLVGPAVGASIHPLAAPLIALAGLTALGFVGTSSSRRHASFGAGNRVWMISLLRCYLYMLHRAGLEPVLVVDEIDKLGVTADSLRRQRECSDPPGASDLDRFIATLVRLKQSLGAELIWILIDSEMFYPRVIADRNRPLGQGPLATLIQDEVGLNPISFTEYKEYRAHADVPGSSNTVAEAVLAKRWLEARGVYFGLCAKSKADAPMSPINVDLTDSLALFMAQVLDHLRENNLAVLARCVRQTQTQAQEFQEDMARNPWHRRYLEMGLMDLAARLIFPTGTRPRYNEIPVYSDSNKGTIPERLTMTGEIGLIVFLRRSHQLGYSSKRFTVPKGYGIPVRPPRNNDDAVLRIEIPTKWPPPLSATS